MRERILTATTKVLGSALLLFLPWSIPAWAVAGTYYCLTGRDKNGPDAGLIVAIAPMLPAVLLVNALDRILPR